MKTYQLKIQINDNGRELEKTIKLKADGAKQLSEKIDALKLLNEAVAHEDLMSTVELIHEKPELITVIKKMLEEGESLSEAQLMIRLPKYVKKVLNVLKS